MKTYAPSDIRNVALVGHGGAGKTTLAESLLFRAKATSRMGHVSDQSSVLDYLPEEHKRGATVGLSLAQFEYRGKKVNLIDTPGFADFEGEKVAGMYAADCLLVVVSADSGVGVGAELAWRRARAMKRPAAIVVNGMDKEHADGMAALKSIREKFGKKATAMQIPMGNGPSFKGVVDILRDQALTFKDGESDKGPVPPEHAEAEAEAHAALMENAAESSEALLNKFFEEGELSQEELIRGLHDGILQGDLFPVFFCSALELHGISQVLDGIVDLLPSPADRPGITGEGGGPLTADPNGPLAIQVFKVAAETHVGDVFYLRNFSGTVKAGGEVYNVHRDEPEKVGQLFSAIGKNRTEVSELSAGDLAVAVKLRSAHTNDTFGTKGSTFKIRPIPFPSPAIDFMVHTKKQGEEDKMGTGLARLVAEDPTLAFHYEEETHESILSGLGETHLELAVQRLHERFHVDVELASPRIAFRETIRGKAEVHARHKKQTGGRGQFADVHLRIEPLPEGQGFEFVDAIVGGVIPGRFIPAVEKGIREAMPRGAIAGYSMVDFKCTLFDGSYHAVDSSEAAFKIAGSMAYRQAAREAKPTILEPYMDVTVVIPQDYMGDVMGDVSQRRGRVQGMEADAGDQVIHAQIPAAEMQRYAMDLRSMTQGRGRFERKFSHYEELPRELQEKVIAEAKAEEEVAK